MKLLLPIGKPQDVSQLLSISSDTEFYSGFELDSWYKLFGEHEDINRMSAFRSQANLNGFAILEQLSAIAKGHELFITLNSGVYSIRQISFLREILLELRSMNISGIIVGDPALAPLVREAGLKAVASTMIGVYNADIAKKCVDLGFQRLIFPRDMTLREMEEIIAACPMVEYESFLMRNGCRYSDSHCLARHSSQYGALCSFLDRARTEFQTDHKLSFGEHEAFASNHLIYVQSFHKSTCGMCAIWDLIQMGISAGKVVGRADGVSSIIEDAQILSDNIVIAKKCLTRDAYLEQMHFPRRYDQVCIHGLNCYYPEARYGGD